MESGPYFARCASRRAPWFSGGSPSWSPPGIGGAPPAYSGEYAGRLYFALTEVPILGATLLALGTRRGPQPLWWQVLPWALLTVSVAAVVLSR